MWELVWRYNLSRVLCRYLLSNGSCGKSRNLTRHKLEQWFRIEGAELVKAWAGAFYRPGKTKAGDKVDTIKTRNGKVVKVGQIKVVGATPRKERE